MSTSEPGEYDPQMQELLQIMWGEGFLSPGGAAEVARLLEGSDISGCRVLDVGCGLGAVDELLITTYGAASVVGIDLDPALLVQMTKRIEHAKLSDRVSAVRVDPGPFPLEDASFDIVFSKDSLVQIPDKAAIFREVYRVLNAGGRLIASDWLRGGPEAYSAEMQEFFRLEGIVYNMATLEESADALRDAGFIDVQIRDRHGWYLELARRELAAMKGELSAVIVERIGQRRAQHFIDNWQQLVLVLERGELRPGHLKATKPPTATP